MAFKCIIVDDEPPATRILENYIGKVNFLEKVGVFNDSLKALEFLNTQTVDVIFLDIQMPQLTGLQISRIISKDIKVIFTTAYPDFALEGFELNAIDYLLKLGIKTLFTVFALILFINFFIHIYPYKVLFIVFTYAFLIGVLLLVLAPLHTIRQRWMITVSVILGTLVTVLLNKFSSLLIYYTHWFGISIAVISAKTYLYFFFLKH